MPKLFEGHARPVTQNIIGSVIFEGLRLGGSPLIGWITKRFTEVYLGVSAGWGIAVWVVVAILTAVLITLIRQRWQREATLQASIGSAADKSSIVPPPLPLPININIENKPSFTNNPHIDQRSVNYQTQQQSQRQHIAPEPEPPAIEPLPVRIREMFVTPLGEVTDEPSSFDTDHFRMPVAIAGFYRAADKYREAFVDVRACVRFTSEDEPYRIDNGFWFKSTRHHARFHPGDTRKLVLAIIHEGNAHPYEGVFKPLEATFETNLKYFVLTKNKLEGKSFHVVVELIGINPQRAVVLNASAYYDLTVDPLAFTFQKITYHD